LSAAVVLALLAEGRVLANPRGAARHRQTEHHASFDPAAVNNPALPPPGPRDRKSPALLRAQILLDRANISPGEIDGGSGRNMQQAVRGYQRKQGLNVTGGLTPETWAALNTDTAPALAPYRITDEDVAGPFEKVPVDMQAQAKLKALSYESPLEALAERFHSNPALLTSLNKGKDLTKAGEEIMVPNVLTNFVAKAASIVVSKSESTVTALDANGNILAQYPASTGSEHDPLPIGEWKVTGVSKNPPFFYNPALFWDAKPDDTKAKLPPGPNNPVGTVWIDLTKEHYGIHGTPEPSRIGYTQSHGCIRLTNWDALELAGMVTPKTPVSMKE